MAEESGQRVGDYEVVALLGSGGMGRVYKVRSIISNREEAMKILLPDFAAEPELAARFMAEIRTLAGLDHPNITQLRTAFQFQNQFVMVMEYVEGTSLDKLPGQLPLEKVLDYSMQVLAALGYAHGKGVTHRDIKPGNIMITTHGVVKLMDFGIAKSTTDLNLTRPGTTMGSIYYMAPEQVRGGAVDGRTDLYSFGVTLYEMLTGRKPFQAETSYSVLNAQLNQAPAPPMQLNPSLPPQLNDIVLRAMAKDPAARFQTAEEFRSALKSLHEPHAAAAAVPAVAPIPVAVPAVHPAPAPVQAAPPPFQPAAAAPAPGPVATPAPGFAPVPVAAAAPRQTKSHRGLWIGLGALAAVLAIVAAATVLPRFYPLHAGQKSGAASNALSASNAASVGTAPLAQPPGATGSSTAGSTSGPSSSGTANSGGTAGTSQPGASNGGGPSAPGISGSPRKKTEPAPPPPSVDTGGGQPQPPSQPAPPPGPSPAEYRQARDHYMDLDARADVVRTQIGDLRRQQQAQGFDLRGDVVGEMNRLSNDLREADRALAGRDLDTAKDYMDRANEELRKLESFLGR